MEHIKSDLILSSEEHNILVDKHIELLGTLEYLKGQRSLSDETAHTEEFLSRFLKFLALFLEFVQSIHNQ